MKTREAMIEVIRARAMSMDLKELERYTKKLPSQVAPGAEMFCTDTAFGPWFAAQMVAYDISATYELHRLLLERKQSVKQAKGVKSPGEKKNVS